jgi:PilZ domain
MAKHADGWLPDRPGRKYLRFNLKLPVFIKFAVGGPVGELEAITENVSIGGFLVRSTAVIPLHTSISFVITVYGEQAERPIYLVGEGNVVRVERNDRDAMLSIAVKSKMPVMQLAQHFPHNEEVM